MTNDPLPHQLTVGQLKELLRDVPDATIVGLAVPPSLHVDSRLTILYNLRVGEIGGPVLKLIPVEA